MRTYCCTMWHNECVKRMRKNCWKGLLKLQKPYVLGLDIGTTSTKAVIFEHTGHVLAEAESSYSISYPRTAWAEQDPRQIEQAAISSLKSAVTRANISSADISAVGMSSAMHSIICVDENTEPLSPVIIWADSRSRDQAQRIKQKHPHIYQKTGTPIHPMSPLAKLVWMKESGYAPYKNAKRFLSVKEYLLQRWFGSSAVDYSVASATGMFNIHTLEWEPEALQLAGITADELSVPVSPTTVVQGLKRDIAQSIGIPRQLPFVIGASDGPLANLGIGAVDPGEVAITVGTSGAIRQMSPTPHVDRWQEVFCYAFTQDLWIMGGPTNNGGIVLEWLRNIIGPSETGRMTTTDKAFLEHLTETASKAQPGANGLLFLPFLNGERAPHWDARARASFVGLTQTHQRHHLIRAVLEGVIYNLYYIGESLRRLAGAYRRILAGGGFARSPLWLQILADIFDTEVEIPQSHQSSAWGAAWVALYALGEVNSLSAIRPHVPMQKTYRPQAEHHETYQRMYLIYKDLYRSLEPHFQALTAIQNDTEHQN